VASAEGDSVLPAGSSDIIVDVPVAELLATRAPSGPFHVVNGTLTEGTSDRVFVATSADMGTTASYNLDGYTPAQTTISRLSATNIDSAGHGLYDTLRVDGAVSVPTAGQYRLTGTVYAPSGAVLKQIDTTQDLVVGRNPVTVSLDGNLVGSTGSGVYQLGGVTIVSVNDPTQHATASTLIVGPLDSSEWIGSAPNTPVNSGTVLYSGATTNLTNQFSATGSGSSNVVVQGNFTCDVATHVGGNVLVYGTAHLTSSCHIDGNVSAGGTVTIDGSPTIDGSISTPGSLTIDSTAHIGGNVTTGGTVTSVNGLTTSQLNSQGIIAGTITTGAAVPAAPLPPFPTLAAVNVSGWTGFTASSWVQWMNATATADSAPTWSAARTSNPGCTMSSVQNSVGGVNASIATNTVIDARQTASNCATITLQGMTLNLSADLTIYANKFAVLNGLTVHSSDHKPHTLRILVPGTTASCPATSQIAFSPATTIDPLIATQLYAPGRITVAGTTSFTGQVEAGCYYGSGTVAITYLPVSTPGHN
jgi:hypothetical protein